MNGVESKKMQARALYFDIIPDGAIYNVVRFLSDSPRAEKWVNYIDLADISGLYGVKGELGKFMLTLCTALLLVGAKPDIFLPSRGEPEAAIRCHVEYLLDLCLPERVAESFFTLVVSYDVIEEVARSHVDLISVKLPNIRKLVLRFASPAVGVWIKKLGPNIESLSLLIFSVDIAKYCPHLQHLYLFNLSECGSIVKAWENVGENLETLSVLTATDAINVIEFVEKFCSKIKRLELSGTDDDVREAISKCIASYGNQLERVRLDYLTENQLMRVKSACPKAKIELFTNEVLLPQTANIVGRELEKATMDFVRNPLEREEASFDWSACANIEKLYFHYDVTVVDIERILKSPKCHLRAFSLSITGELKKVRAAISLIAKGTGGLEEFWFSCKDASIGIGMFTELVDSNRSMHNVEIRLRDSARKNEVATDIVKTFLKSPSLKNLEVSGPHMQLRDSAKIPEIERICRIEGYRRVCISVFDVLYLR